MTVLAPLVVTLVLSPLHVATSAPLFAVAPAAMDPEAKERFDRGLTGYTAKEYARAIKDFRLAYALDPRAEILFAWAQAERMYGRCSQATKLYTRFLKSKPSEQQAGAARTGIDRCKNQPDTTPADPEDVEEPEKPVAPEKPPEPEPEPEPPPPPPRRVDVLGISLLGVGVALGATGGALIGVGENKAKQLGGVTSYEDYSDGVGRIRTLRIAGSVLAGVGGALIIGGIVKLIVGKKQQSRRDVGFWTDPRGAGLIVRMRF